MTGLFLNIAVAPNYQRLGVGSLLAKRVFYLLRLKGATTAEGFTPDGFGKEIAGAFVESIGFVYKDKDNKIGWCDIDITDATYSDVPDLYNEVLTEHMVSTNKEEWPDDDSSVPTTFLAWYEKNTGRAVAKAKFKVI